MLLCKKLFCDNALKSWRCKLDNISRLLKYYSLAFFFKEQQNLKPDLDAFKPSWVLCGKMVTPLTSEGIQSCTKWMLMCGACTIVDYRTIENPMVFTTSAHTSAC